jgi:hypothetical protein
MLLPGGEVPAEGGEIITDTYRKFLNAFYSRSRIIEHAFAALRTCPFKALFRPWVCGTDQQKRRLRAKKKLSNNVFGLDHAIHVLRWSKYIGKVRMNIPVIVVVTLLITIWLQTQNGPLGAIKPFVMG